MKISIIIPTHNRAESLQNAIKSILQLTDEADLELVVVDNNSADDTKEVIDSFSTSHPDIIKYAFEGRTAFSKARSTGAENATGEIFLYIDDDVLIRPGSLRRIVEVFTQYSDCGVIAGKILPKYTETPPEWTLACQKSFNGWSLFGPDTIPGMEDKFQKVPSAAGPMMAIRRSAYEEVGGFPPDTVGVETNIGTQTFQKLYIGPGDYGLCLKARKAGFEVYYSPDVSCFHVIPSVRFTLGFWRSRMIGEGHYVAIAKRGFFHIPNTQALVERKRAQINFYRNKRDLRARLSFLESKNDETPEFDGMFPEELWVRYYAAYLEMDWVLRKHPDLDQFLWKIGAEGVADYEFDDVVNHLPMEYKKLISSDIIQDASPLNAIPAFDQLLGGLNPDVIQECEKTDTFIQSLYHTLHQQDSNVQKDSLLNSFLSDEHSETAIRGLEIILASDTNNTELLKWIGCVHAEAGRSPIAGEYIERARKASPTDAEILRLAEQLNTGRIVTPATRSNHSFNNKASALFQEGAIFLTNDDPGAALAKFDEAMYLDSKLPDLHFSRGKCLARLNRKKEAIHAAIAELMVQPSHSPAMNFLLSEVDVSIEGIKAAPNVILSILDRIHRDTNLQIPGFQKTRALCLTVLSRLEEARHTLGQAVLENPTDEFIRSFQVKIDLVLRHQRLSEV